MTKTNAFFLFGLFIANLLAIYFAKIKLAFQEVFIMYSFLFALFLFTQLIQNKLLKKSKKQTYLLLAINIFRIFVCLVFLSPTILNTEKSDSFFVINFFIVYFFILYSEVFIKYKNIKK